MTESDDPARAVAMRTCRVDDRQYRLFPGVKAGKARHCAVDCGGHEHLFSIWLLSNVMLMLLSNYINVKVIYR
jgi:hypothetical protein